MKSIVDKMVRIDEEIYVKLSEDVISWKKEEKNCTKKKNEKMKHQKKKN